MGVPACAEMLQVSERTIRGWESGATRIPYAAYKLMRLLRGGKVLGSEWKGFHVWRGVLCTPEGHRFVASDLSWLAFLVMQARCFRQLMSERRAHTQSAQALCVPAPLKPVDSGLQGGVGSSPSTPRALVQVAGGDPSLVTDKGQDSGESTGQIRDSLGNDLEPKSLKSKRNPPGSLSLTLPVRQTSAQLPRSRKLPRSFKAVQS